MCVCVCVCGGGGGGLICGSKRKASETIDNIRQNKNLYLKKKLKNLSNYSSIYS